MLVVFYRVVICLGQGADLRMAQLMPLPLTVSCYKKIQIGFLVPAHPDSAEQNPESRKTVAVQCTTVGKDLCTYVNK